ncbi:MAG: hypothetical protein EAZ31_06885, partial [Cytophagia bacterium]
MYFLYLFTLYFKVLLNINYKKNKIMLQLFVYRFLGIFILSFIFQGLFWNEEVSLNLLIFSSLLSI